MTVFPTALLSTEWLFPFGALKSFRYEQLSQRAEQMALRLNAAPRLPVWEVQDTSLVLEGRRFCKLLPEIDEPRIKNCRRELLALKLGLLPEVFHHNPGFEKFAEENHLERYLLEYRQGLLVDPEEKRLSILMDNRYVAWESAQEAMACFPRHMGSPLQPWRYGPKGIQQDDMYDWVHLRPYRWSDPEEWGWRYLFELVVCCGENPHKTGDHGWLRLRTPEGNVYSVGLYRPQKRSLSDNWKAPFRVKRGYLMMPDVSEFWPGKIRSLRVGITREQFQTMVRAIERDKSQDRRIFQLFQSNCVLWAATIAREAGVEIPVGRCSALRLLVPRPLEPFLDAVPALLQAIAGRVAAIFINSIQLLLGAGIVDEEVTQHNGPGVRPHIGSWGDFFDPEKMALHHPWTFGNDTLRGVERWRAAQVARLRENPDLISNPELLQKRVAEIQYLVPHPKGC